MEAFFAIVSREWREAVASEVGWRVSVIHLAISLLACLLGWPGSYPLGQATWAPALVMWVYAEALVLSYLAIAVPADIVAPETHIRPGHWILYGDASPFFVHLGQTVATLLALAFWLATSTPAMLLGLLLRPVSASELGSLGLFFLLLFTTLSQIGAWIGIAIESKVYRVLIVDIAYLLLMLGTLVVRSTAVARVAAFLGTSLLAQVLQPFVGLAEKVAKWTENSGAPGELLIIHPFDVSGRILNATFLEAFTFTGFSSAGNAPAPTNQLPVPWLQIVAVYGGTLILAAALSLVWLKQWQSRYSHNRTRRDA